MPAIMCYNTVSRIPFTFGVEIVNVANKTLFLDEDNIVKLFQQGRTMQSLADMNGCSLSPIQDCLSRRGIDTSRSWRNKLARNSEYTPQDILDMYNSGMWKKDIAKRIGCLSEGKIGTILEEFGISKAATRSEAMSNRLKRMTPEERSELAESAHNKVRGMKWSNDSLIRGALGKEKAARMDSISEKVLYDALVKKGITPIIQKAFWKYNVDFLIGNLAVEVTGASRHPDLFTYYSERLKYLLNSGLTVVYVWTRVRYFPTENAINYIISLSEQASSDPSILGKYWVIRCDGKTLATGCANDDDFTSILSSKGCFNFRGDKNRIS